MVAGNPDSDLATRRLSLARRVLEVTEDAGLARGLGQVETLLPRLVVSDPVLCHGDFHPMNILVADSAVWVIDWTDAGVGDRHGDVARTAWLFKMAAVGAASGTESAMKVLGPILARGYLSAYGRRAPLDSGRVRLWEPLQLLHLWALTMADDLELRGPSQAGRVFSRGLGEWARQQFELAMKRVLGPHEITTPDKRDEPDHVRLITHRREFASTKYSAFCSGRSDTERALKIPGPLPANSPTSGSVPSPLDRLDTSD